MRPIELDFAPRPALPRVLAAGLLLLGVLALAAVLLRAGRLQAQIGPLAADLEAAQRATRHQRVPLAPAPGPGQEADAEALAQANRIVASLNLPWGALFRQIESVRSAGVTLLALQPEPGQAGTAARRLRITGQARRLDEALAYVRQISQVPGFARGHLVTHEAVQDGGQNAVRFMLVLDWVAQP